MFEIEVNRFPGAAAFADGRYVAPEDAKVSLFDWGFTRSDATYDVASVWQGAFFRLDDHLDRFFASLAKLRLQVPHSREEVRSILHGCVRAAGLREAYVAMVCTRGVPPRGSRDPRLATNRFYAVRGAVRLDRAAGEAARRASTCTSARAIGSRREAVDPTVKNYHWLDLVQALFDAYDRGDDTSVRRRRRTATSPKARASTSSSSSDGVVRTPRARRPRRDLAAHARSSCASALGIPVRVEAVPVRALDRRRRGLPQRRPAAASCRSRAVDGRPLPHFPGPVTRRLQDAYWALHAEPRHRDPVRLRRAAPEDGQHAGVAVQVVARDLAAGEEAHQRHVAQRMPHDRQLGRRRAEVRPAASGAAHVDRARRCRCAAASPASDGCAAMRRYGRRQRPPRARPPRGSRRRCARGRAGRPRCCAGRTRAAGRARRCRRWRCRARAGSRPTRCRTRVSAPKAPRRAMPSSLRSAGSLRPTSVCRIAGSAGAGRGRPSPGPRAGSPARAGRPASRWRCRSPR